jgi:hypothetical protein
MNLEKDLKELRKQKQMKESAIAQLRKRSKEKEVKTQLLDQKRRRILLLKILDFKEFK